MNRMIGIIGAMQKEVDLVISRMHVNKTENISGFVFFEGFFNGIHVVVVKCGVGKVFAAACTQLMIVRYNPSLVLNIGVAGALSDELNIADVAIADMTVQFDMDTTAVGDPLGLVSGINKVYFECDEKFVNAISDCVNKLSINMKSGVFATGDCFLNDKGKKKKIIDAFNAITCEMESASIGHVCFINKTRFGAIRTISDKGDENSNLDYQESLDKACSVLFSVIDNFFKNITSYNFDW